MELNNEFLSTDVQQVSLTIYAKHFATFVLQTVTLEQEPFKRLHT